MYLNRKSLVEKIYTILKEDIIQVHFGAGELLTEARLAERFKVSKTPVREALNRLNLDGYIEILPHKGYMVSSISFADIHNLFQLRSILEVGIMDTVVEKMLPERLAMLEKMIEFSVETPDENGFRAYAEANFRFHTFLVETANNTLLSAYYQNVLNQLRRILLTDFKSSQKEVVTREHRELLAAIKNKDVTAAREIIAKHIEKARQRIIHL